MKVEALIALLEKLPKDAVAEAWNGINDEPMPVTSVEFCAADCTVGISSLTKEQSE